MVWETPVRRCSFDQREATHRWSRTAEYARPTSSANILIASLTVNNCSLPEGLVPHGSASARSASGSPAAEVLLSRDATCLHILNDLGQ